MQVRVEFYGRAGTQTGERELTLELAEGSSLRAVADAVVSRFPILAWVPAICRPARNLEYARWEDVVQDGDEVSFIPPVSGGSIDDPLANCVAGADDHAV